MGKSGPKPRWLTLPHSWGSPAEGRDGQLFPIHGEVRPKAGMANSSPFMGKSGRRPGWGRRWPTLPHSWGSPAEGRDGAGDGQLFPIHGEVRAEGRDGAGDGQLFPIHGEVRPKAGMANSSPFMGKSGRRPGWGRRWPTLPHSWGSPAEGRDGAGDGQLFPIHGEVRPKAGMGPEMANSSPFMGKSGPKAGMGPEMANSSPFMGKSGRRPGWGRRWPTLPHSWGSPGEGRDGAGDGQLFPIHGEVRPKAGMGPEMANSSPFMGKSGRRPGWGRRWPTLPHSWGSPDRRPGWGRRWPTLPHSWGSPAEGRDGAGDGQLFPIHGEVRTEGRDGAGDGQLFPIHGEVRPKAGMGPEMANSSPFMGKSGPKAGMGPEMANSSPFMGKSGRRPGWGRRWPTLPHSWGSPAEGRDG